MGNFLVVGGSSGIGKALVSNLEKLGHQVHATYYMHPQDSRQNIHYHFLNVTQDIDLTFAPEELHGFAYCPGAINLKPFSRTKESDFLMDYQLQVGGAIRVLQAVLPKLKNTSQASVVFFSTVAVQQGFNFHSIVSSSKGAIEGLTRALSAELAPEIRVNAIAPSLTDTPLAARFLNSDQKREAQAVKNPMKRLGTAEDIAQAATYLLTNQSSYVTGQIIRVDGGKSSIK